MVAEANSQSSVKKKKILLLYPYYWPHYKAGGPVQSLFNIVTLFKHQADFFLLSLNHDIDGQRSEITIKINQWVKGPNHENIYFVSFISPLLIFRMIKQIRPDSIFVNGIFNVSTTIPGIFFGKVFRVSIIISPRGMLQEWGLKRNKFIKQLFLFLFKVILKKDECWHATDEQEKQDVLKHFGKKQKVFIASNIPKRISGIKQVEFPDATGKIRLVFLSLINPNKNLHMVIDSVKGMSNFTLDIYGPIIDQGYWRGCQEKISRNEGIAYKGPVPAWQVSSVLSNYHFFILPTQGENFGHAIFDALSVSLPVIVTRNTPWKSIEESQAGYYIDLQKPNSIQKILGLISQMRAETYQKHRTNALAYAKNYWNTKNYSKEYEFLF